MFAFITEISGQTLQNDTTDRAFCKSSETFFLRRVVRKLSAQENELPQNPAQRFPGSPNPLKMAAFIHFLPLARFALNAFSASK